MKAEILAALRASDGYVSGQDLCGKFGVSRTAIWKAINQLKQAGYEIEAVQNRGYHIVSTPDILSENELRSIRKTEWLGNKIYYETEIDSTNTKAMKLAEEGAPHGTIVVTDHQTNGRGRRGRSWESPAGEAIAMTFLLRPKIDPNNASMLTLIAAMAVARGIEDETGLKAGIKWPNDVVINRKKVSGILTEMSAQADYVNHIVVGIGINVHIQEFPEELKNIATSVFLELGMKINRAALIERICEYFEAYFEVFLQTEDLSAISKQYDAYMVNRNQPVKVLDPKDTYEGTARGITTRGELLVDTWESRKLVSSGEVSVRGIYGYI
ncbi:Bifunctional ligase/repressor BirA [Eubacterium plexicaudatum ASF492]|uniref:Bifunctional ligase/repressor BirA n=1 Tax=Eubacterium plexicaudatum ASF492 TaxID=1235802 RepID=N2AUX1_9FIRM|nr:Bifunctional ligase/repressor BirA [Eubacterium plexicaudatum ASF492]